jgi:hypothetical protein
VVLDKNVFDEMEHRPFATGIHRVRFFIGEVIFQTNSGFILSGYIGWCGKIGFMFGHPR